MGSLGLLLVIKNSKMHEMQFLLSGSIQLARCKKYRHLIQSVARKSFLKKMTCELNTKIGARVN
jgi:hypothetical protein